MANTNAACGIARQYSNRFAMKTLHFLAFTAFVCASAHVATPRDASAQQVGVLNAAVRDEDGNGLAGARVRVVARGIDTTLRATDRGLISVTLPYGTAQVTASYIGFEAADRSVEIDKPVVQTSFALRTVARQIGAMEIRENWVGVRGIIGDNYNRLPIAGAEVMVPQQKKRILTDSLGRFDLPLTNTGPVVVQVSAKGYETRVMSLTLNAFSGTDVVYFLAPGNGPNGEKNMLRDLQQRLSTLGNRSFVADRNSLARDGATTVYDAVLMSGLLQKNGLKFGPATCLLVNGRPRYGFPVSTVKVDDIDFIEVYGAGADIGNSLSMTWGRQPCPRDPNVTAPASQFDAKRNIQFVSVWTRNRNDPK